MCVVYSDMRSDSDLVSDAASYCGAYVVTVDGKCSSWAVDDVI